jgi:hypothetical protein
MKTIIKNILAVILLLTPFTAFTQDQNSGDLKVTVFDERNEPMVGAVVRIVAGGPSLGGQTNLDGNFTFRALQPGTYDVEVYLPSYKRFTKQGIIVSVGQTAYAEYKMQVAINNCDTCSNVVVITADRGPVNKTFSTVQNLDAEMVKNMPVVKGDVKMMVVNTCSSCNTGPKGGLVMRGSRENASAFFVDGEKLYGQAGVPGGAIQQVTILSGGIPASYGDLTGGAVIITTKSFYNGMAAKENMYLQAAEEKKQAEIAEQEKNGKVIMTDSLIIEKQEVVPVDSTQKKEEATPAGNNNSTNTPATDENKTVAPKQEGIKE